MKTREQPVCNSTAVRYGHMACVAAAISWKLGRKVTFDPKTESFVSDAEFALGGYYDDRLVRTAEGWKIEAVTLTVLWNRGNRHIMDMAVARGRERLAES